MKITKQQLKELIKEELETVLNEAGGTWDPVQAKKKTEKAAWDKSIVVPGDPAGQEKEADFSALGMPQRYVKGSEKAAFIPPVKGGVVTSPVDPERFHPIKQRVIPHKGLDIGAEEGTPIVHSSPISGKVVGGGYKKTIDPKTGQETGAGQTVMVRTPDQLPDVRTNQELEDFDYDAAYDAMKSNPREPMGATTTQAMHLVPGSNAPIGTTVSQGQTIGKVGTSGGITGPHLHHDPAFGGSEQERLAAAGDVYGTYDYTPKLARQRPAAEEPPAVASATLEPRDVGWEAGDPDAIRAPVPKRGYEIKKGDNLSKLARSLGPKVTVKDIMKVNPGIDPNLIKTGQFLNLPAGKRDDDEGVPKPGQNLAEAWGFSMDINKLNE